MSMDGLYEENAWSNFLSKSSFHNEEDGRLLACPSGASVENQSFVLVLENDQSFSTSDALTWIPTEALKSRISRYHGYIHKAVSLDFL